MAAFSLSPFSLSPLPRLDPPGGRLGDIILRRSDRARVSEAPQRFALADHEGEVFEGNCFQCLKRFIRRRNGLISNSRAMLEASRSEMSAHDDQD